MAAGNGVSVAPFVRRSGRRAALALLSDWLPIFASIAVAERVPWLYPLALLVISSRMLGLHDLAHEALHNNLFQNRRLHDPLDFLFATPFFYRNGPARRQHLLGHHKMVDEEKHQPAYGYYYFHMNPSRVDEPWYMVWILFGRPLLGFHALLQAWWILKDLWTFRKDQGMLLFHGILAIALTALSAWKLYLLYWLVPYVAVYSVLWFWRDMLTHFKARDPSGSRDTRHWLATLLLSPHKFLTYHTLHHAWPSVPWFAMEEANAKLMDDSKTVCTTSLVEGFRQMIVPDPGNKAA